MESKVFVISRILGQNNKLLGFNLFDRDSYERRPISYEQCVYALRNGAEIRNLKLVGNELVGSMGSLSRYTAVDVQGILISNQSIVIIDKNHKNEFLYVDYTGSTRGIYSEELYDLVTLTGINVANYKVYKNEAGTVCAVSLSDTKDTTNHSERTSENNALNIYSNGKHKKKYHFPELERGASYRETFVEGSILKGARSFTNRQGLKWIDNGEVLYKKRGLIETGYDNNNKKVLRGSWNDVFRYKSRSYIEFKLIGVRLANDEQILAFVGRRTYEKLLLKDILYIGGAWKSATNLDRIHSKDSNDSTIIGLGQLGLVIIKVVEVKGYLDTVVKVIAYSKINNIDSLIKELVANDIESGMLDKSDANYILETANTSPFKLRYNPDLDKIKGARIYVDKYKEEKSLIGIESILTMLATSTLSGLRLRVDDKTRSFIEFELNKVIDNKDVVAFNQSPELIVKMPEALVRKGIRESNGEMVFEYNSMPVRYLAYYILHSKNMLAEFSTNILDDNTAKMLYDNIVWGYTVTKDRINLYVESARIIYDIKGLIEQYKPDCDIANRIANSSRNIENKLNLLGVSATIDNRGYLTDWEDNTIINQTKTIKGVVLNNENRHKKIVINTLPNSNIGIIKEGYFYADITVTYRWEDIDKMLSELSRRYDRPYKTGINFDGCDCSQLNNLISIVFRKIIDTNARYMNSDGVSVAINIDTKEITMPFILRNAGKLYTNEKDFNYSITANPLKLVNLDRIDAVEKAKFIKMILPYIPKRKGKSRTMAGDIVKQLLSMLYQGYEYEKLSVEFEKWFKN